MGKIKSKMIKRTSKQLTEQGIEFSEDFGENKKTLGQEMPSKKIRNKMAGYLVRMKKAEKKKAEELSAKTQ